MRQRDKPGLARKRTAGDIGQGVAFCSDLRVSDAS
jgi:hypothetical protein